jgi:hypothetical protein
MTLIIQILIGAAVLIGAFLVLQLIGAIVGLLGGLLLAGVIGAAIYAAIAGRLNEMRGPKGPSRREVQKRTAAVERELSSLEERLRK